MLSCKCVIWFLKKKKEKENGHVNTNLVKGWRERSDVDIVRQLQFDDFGIEFLLVGPQYAKMFHAFTLLRDHKLLLNNLSLII